MHQGLTESGLDVLKIYSQMYSDLHFWPTV